jgi:RNA polymerase sigma-70 factor, ECF subfamily
MTESADRLYERMLVLRCQTQDEVAFEELVERYSPRLRYYLRKMLGDSHQAEDVLQDVWWDAYRSLTKLADADAFRTWRRNRSSQRFISSCSYSQAASKPWCWPHSARSCLSSCRAARPCGK